MFPLRPDSRGELNYFSPAFGAWYYYLKRRFWSHSLSWTLTWSCKMASKLLHTHSLLLTELTCAVTQLAPDLRSEPPPAVWATLLLPHTQKPRTPPRCQTPQTPSLPIPRRPVLPLTRRTVSRLDAWAIGACVRAWTRSGSSDPTRAAMICGTAWLVKTK